MVEDSGLCGNKIWKDADKHSSQSAIKLTQSSPLALLSLFGVMKERVIKIHFDYLYYK